MFSMDPWFITSLHSARIAGLSINLSPFNCSVVFTAHSYCRFVRCAGRRCKQTVVVQFLYLGRPYQRDRRHFARHQTAGQTRVGIGSGGAVRYGDRFIHAEGAHAKVRGDGDPAVWVCDVDSRRIALRRGPQRAP